MKTNLTQVTNIKSWSLGLEMENNLPTDRIRIKFRLGWGLKCGIRSRQGFRLRFKEWMLSVEVVRSVVRQMWVFACMCFMEEEETAHQKAGKPPCLSTEILFEIWDSPLLNLTTFRLHCECSEQRDWEIPANTFTFKVHTRKTHSSSLPHTHTHTRSEWRKQQM